MHRKTGEILVEPSAGIVSYPVSSELEINNINECDWHPDSDKLLCSTAIEKSQCNHLAIYSSNGKELSSIPNMENSCIQVHQMKWSPDGAKIMFLGYLPESNTGDIYIMNIDGTGLKNLTNSSAMDGGPVWSPDGSYILFSSVQNGSSNIFRMDTNGNNLTQLTTTGDAGGAVWQP